MGKSFKKRIKKRKQERSAKHRRPASAVLTAAGKQKNDSPGGGKDSKAVIQTKMSKPSLVLENLKRSPVLSRYLDPESNLLVVGDGDFSFGKALVQLRSKYQQQTKPAEKGIHDDNSSCGSLTVTGYDSRSEALRKYASGSGNTSSSSKQYSQQKKKHSTEIEKSLLVIENQQHARVLHSIDATKLNQQLGPDHFANQSNSDNHQRSNQSNCYDVVVFNFPHSGQQRVHINRNLMYDFFQSVRDLFVAQQNDQKEHSKKPRKVRQVHVTIKNQRPYIHWEIEASAKEAGFMFSSHKKNKVNFDMKLWNSLGYRHQTTVGPQEATSQPQLLAKSDASEAKLAQTWIFDFEADHQHNNAAIINLRKQMTSRDASPQKEPSQPKPQEYILPQKSLDADEKKEEEANLAQQSDPVKKGQRARGGNTKDNEICKKDIEELIQKRDQARQDKKWAEADRIRELLLNDYSVVLCDQKATGTTWSWQKNKKQETRSDAVNMPTKKKRKRNHSK